MYIKQKSPNTITEEFEILKGMVFFIDTHTWTPYSHQGLWRMDNYLVWCNTRF